MPDPGSVPVVKPYVFKYGTEPWPEGVTLLQFYAPVDLHLETNHELADLTSRWTDAIRSYPITLLESSDYHITCECVTDRVGADIPDSERAELISAVRRELDGVSAYVGRAGGAVGYSSGVIVDVSPAAPLTDSDGPSIHTRLRAAVHSVRGPESTRFPISKAHISLGYATAEADSDRITRSLRPIDPNNAPLYLPRIDLVEVTVDQAAGRLTWTTVESFPLSRN